MVDSSVDSECDCTEQLVARPGPYSSSIYDALFYSVLSVTEPEQSVPSVEPQTGWFQCYSPLDAAVRPGSEEIIKMNCHKFEAEVCNQSSTTVFPYYEIVF